MLTPRRVGEMFIRNHRSKFIDAVNCFRGGFLLLAVAMLAITG